MKWNNLLESVIDVGSGFILAILIQLLIFPLFGLHPTILDSLGIALIFTVVSMTRSWLWRCYFRRKHDIKHKEMSCWVKNAFNKERNEIKE